MKIIATDGKQYEKTFFLTATEAELKNLMGYGTYGTPREKEERLTAGGVIPISKMYDRLYRMANMERELTEISAKLKTAADFVNTALPTIQNVNKKDGGEEKSE